MSPTGGLVTESCLTLVTPWTVAHQASLSIGIFRQEYWSGVPFPPPGDLPCVADGPAADRPAADGPAADGLTAGLLAGGGGATGRLAAGLLAVRGQARAAAGWLAAGAGLAAHWGAEEGQAGDRGAAAGGTAGGLAAALWTVIAQVAGADGQGGGCHGGVGGAGGRFACVWVYELCV